MRVGIGRPPGRLDPADFVLSTSPRPSARSSPINVVEAADAVESLITDGLEKTQQRFNR